MPKECLTIQNLKDNNDRYILNIKEVSIEITHMRSPIYLPVGRTKYAPSIYIFMTGSNSLRETYIMNGTGYFSKEHSSHITVDIFGHNNGVQIQYSMTFKQQDPNKYCMRLAEENHIVVDYYNVSVLSFLVSNVCGQLMHNNPNVYMYAFMPYYYPSAETMVYYSICVIKCAELYLPDYLSLELKYNIHQTATLTQREYFFQINSLVLMIFYEKRSACLSAIRFRINIFTLQVNRQTCSPHHVSVS